MPPTRATRRTQRRHAAATDQVNAIPADLDLNGLYLKDLRAMCSRLHLSTTGTRAALVKRLEEARQNSANAATSHANQNGGSDIVDGDLRLPQQFDSLKQQVQALLDRESSNEQLLSPGQLTQVQSLIQSSMNEAIEKTATAAAQAAVNAFRGPSPPQTEEQDRDPSTSRENEVRPINSNASTADSVHELPAKLAKEILSGEFMELSKLLPKNYNSLKPLHDEPLTLTLENSVIRVNKARATSITDIEEWTTAFTAYMSVIINKFPSRSAELLEYLSLIRYAAKYHRGLGWCVYDIKFRQKAASNKSLVWSAIDSQLWLKTFTVAPSLMKEEIGVFLSGPSQQRHSTPGGNDRTCHNFNKGFTCARTPCPYLHKCNRPGCGGDHIGVNCPSLSGVSKAPPPRAEKSHPQHHGARHRDK